MSESPASPLARLVLFIVCIAVIGSIFAGAYMLATGLVHPAVPSTPLNRGAGSACNAACHDQWNACMESPQGRVESNPCMKASMDCKQACVCTGCKDTCSDDYNACIAQPGSTGNGCKEKRDICEEDCDC